MLGEPTHDDRYGQPRVLVGALCWRARREGFRYLLLGFLPYVFMLCLLVGLALSGAGINGAATFSGYATSYGARVDSTTVGVVLIEGPALVAMFAATAVAMVVRNLVGSEASRGGIEALLAGPYRSGAIMTALLGYVGGLAVCYWAGMTALAAAALALLVWTHNVSLTLTGSYLALVLILPLLAALSATSLSLLVNLLYPRLAQTGAVGINIGGGGLGTGAAILPALAVFLVLSLWAPHISPGILLAIAGSATAIIAAASTVLVSYRFQPDAVLES